MKNADGIYCSAVTTGPRASGSARDSRCCCLLTVRLASSCGKTRPARYATADLAGRTLGLFYPRPPNLAAHVR